MDFVRKEPFVKDSKVVSIVVGATEVDGDYSAYIDRVCQIDEEDQKALSAWTESEVDDFCDECAEDHDWQATLNAAIQGKKDAAVPEKFPFA
jgi:hypothetical protein